MPTQLQYGDGRLMMGSWALFFLRLMEILQVSTLTELFEMASSNGWFPVNRTGDITVKEQNTINAFADYLGVPHPRSYSESRPEGIAMLCSWRILR